MKEVKKKLPQGWRWVSLGDTSLITLIMGQSPPSETYNKEQKGLPFFQGCTDFGRIHPEPTVWCSDPNRIAEPNDILMTVRAPVGPTNIAKEKCCIGRGIAAIRCKEGLSYKYLIWVLRKFEKQIASEGAGSVFDAIGKDEMKKIEFPFPFSVTEQLKTADMLEHKMNELEKMRQAALKQKEAISAMHGAILREIFPPKEGDKLPVGWRWEEVSNVCFLNPRMDRTVPRDANALTSFVPMDAIDEEKGVIAKIINRKYSEISKGYTFFANGDVLFAKITPCMQNGKSAIAENLIDGIGFGSTEFHVFRPKEGTLKEWIYYFVRTSEFRKRAEDHFTGSAGQQRVPTDFLEEALIPMPPRIDEQIRIVAKLKQKVNELEKMSDVVDKKLEAIEAMQGAILRETFDFQEVNN
ncbi:MAG: restriction endonuclease subunit S [Candidatus Omnitrophota bacterium]|nr:restriction endonuclease subunit S [Candidatus Omnitrophota bacterium]